MKSISPRERLMVLFIPSAILLLIYGFFILPPLSEEKEELDRQLRSLRLQVPSQADRMRVQRELSALRREVNVLRGEGNRNQGASGRSVFSPAEVLQASARLEELILANGVILMSETRADAQGNRLYQPLLAKRPGSEISRLELAGTFAGVSGLVGSLEETGPALVPVALEMDAGMQAETDLRRWNLWICR